MERWLIFFFIRLGICVIHFLSLSIDSISNNSWFIYSLGVYHCDYSIFFLLFCLLLSFFICSFCLWSPSFRIIIIIILVMGKFCGDKTGFLKKQASIWWKKWDRENLSINRIRFEYTLTLSVNCEIQENETINEH